MAAGAKAGGLGETATGQSVVVGARVGRGAGEGGLGGGAGRGHGGVGASCAFAAG